MPTRTDDHQNHDISEAPHLVNLSETTVAKEGNVFSVTLHDGSLPFGEDHPLGVYADDCRVLSGHELRIGGSTPRLLVTSEPTGAAVVHDQQLQRQLPLR